MTAKQLHELYVLLNALLDSRNLTTAETVEVRNVRKTVAVEYMRAVDRETK